MFNILSSLGYEFYEQFPVRSGFIIDFAIIITRDPFKAIGIETDGNRWHLTTRGVHRDGIRDEILGRAGWRILRFGEKFTKDEVKTRIEKARAEFALSPGHSGV